jgi:hypothetical protein
MRAHARLLSIAAAEAVGEPDTISRRPEVIDALSALADDPAFAEAVERVAPLAMSDPQGEAARLAQELAPYRTEPLDDAPELIERLAFVAWALNAALGAEQAVESPALTVA